MKHYLAGTCVALFIFSGQIVVAGTVQQACLMAATLNSKDQSLAAAIIRNPDNVTDIKSSKRRTHAQFMERYSQFGELARAFCS